MSKGVNSVLIYISKELKEKMKKKQGFPRLFSEIGFWTFLKMSIFEKRKYFLENCDL